MTQLLHLAKVKSERTKMHIRPSLNRSNDLAITSATHLQRAIGNQALVALVPRSLKPSKVQRQPLNPSKVEQPTLQKGAQGPKVVWLQQKLNAAGLTPLHLLAVDGNFGAQTEQQLQEFQRRRGLPATGVADSITWLALGQVAYGEPQPTPGQQQTARAEPPWLAIARAEIGVKEIVGKQHNPRVLQYLSATRGRWSTDETPWCSGFVNWVMAQAGYSNTGSAAALSWLKWGKKVSNPVVGAIGVIDHGGGKGHVGFVAGKQGNNLLLLGGNQRNAVRISVYPISKFSAFVFPSDYVVPATDATLPESTKNYGKALDFKQTR